MVFYKKSQKGCSAGMSVFTPIEITFLMSNAKVVNTFITRNLVTLKMWVLACIKVLNSARHEPESVIAEKP